MLLSIIIPLYNNEKYILNCLDSVIAQDLSVNNYEVLVINDGSTDNSALKVNNYTKKYDNIFLFNQKNSGVGAARNKGIELAKGEYIYFLDSDDYVAQNCFNFLLQIAIKNDLDILGFKSENTNKVEQFEWNKNITNEDIKIQNGISYVSENGFNDTIWWYLIKKDFLIKTQLKFNEIYWAEDALFNCKIIYKAKKISTLNTLIHKYVQIDTSIMHSKDSFKYNKLTYSFLNLVREINLIIGELKTEKNNSKLISYYKKKRDSLAFFLLGRSFKSNLKLSELKTISESLKKSEAYPIIYFNEKNDIKYRLILIIFNNKFLLHSSFLTVYILRKLRIIR